MRYDHQCRFGLWWDHEDVAVGLFEVNFSGEGLALEEHGGGVGLEDGQNAVDLFVPGVEAEEVVALTAVVLGLVVYEQLVGAAGGDEVVGVRVGLVQLFYAVVVRGVVWAAVDCVLGEALFSGNLYLQVLVVVV